MTLFSDLAVYRPVVFCDDVAQHRPTRVAATLLNSAKTRSDFGNTETKT